MSVEQQETATVVTATMRRSYTADMFDDLTDSGHERTWDKTTGATTLTFTPVLSDEVAQQVCYRMASRDDDDQARRADIVEKRDAVVAIWDAVETFADLVELVHAIAELQVTQANYQLGEA